MSHSKPILKTFDPTVMGVYRLSESSNQPRHQLADFVAAYNIASWLKTLGGSHHTKPSAKHGQMARVIHLKPTPPIAGTKQSALSAIFDLVDGSFAIA